MKLASLIIPATVAVAFLAACEDESRPRQRENTAARTGGGNQFGYQPTEGTATDFVTDATPTPTPQGTPTPAPSMSDQAFVDATPTPTPAPEATATETRDIPYATPVPGRPGFVTSPFAPYEGYVDVRGYPPNTEVKDPYSGKIFLVP